RGPRPALPQAVPGQDVPGSAAPEPRHRRRQRRDGFVGLARGRRAAGDDSRRGARAGTVHARVGARVRAGRGARGPSAAGQPLKRRHAGARVGTRVGIGVAVYVHLAAARGAWAQAQAPAPDKLPVPWPTRPDEVSPYGAPTVTAPKPEVQAPGSPSTSTSTST